MVEVYFTTVSNVVNFFLIVSSANSGEKPHFAPSYIVRHYLFVLFMYMEIAQRV